MAQSIKHPTLDFGSGHDLTVHEFKPHELMGRAVQSPLGILSLSLSLCPSLLTLSPLLSKQIKKKDTSGWFRTIHPSQSP